MKSLVISIIPFLNTKPFLFGLRHSGFARHHHLSFDIPSVCARKIMKGDADIGLIPVAMIPFLKKYQVITDYCIGASGNVQSVILATNTPKRLIKKIYLDRQSVTSVLLARIIVEKFWKINVCWKPMKKLSLKKNDEGLGYVFIGDRALKLRAGFRHIYDLSGEWKKHTGFPFVFACWVARTGTASKHINTFKKALQHGLDNINSVISESQPDFHWTDVRKYLTRQISYKLDQRKISGMNLFWKLSKNYIGVDGNTAVL